METVKGFKDYTEQEAQKRAEIKKVLVETFEKYGFEPAETPIVEYQEFIKGNSEQQNDEAISDIFKLKDKGKRELALRYEFTFQLKRLMQNKKLPFKRYQIGPVFRDEPTTTNRLRQFTQCDIDTISSTSKDEAEILSLAKEVLDKLKIKFIIYFNNRKLLNEILEDIKINEKNKNIVIKIIDKLDKIPEKEIKEELKKFNAEKLLDILKKKKTFFKKYSSFKEIEELEKYLKYWGLEKEVKFSPSLARGLSYYNGTIFEIKTTKIKETICGGGSYEFNNIQSTGISFGLERLSSLTNIESKKEKILILSINQDKKAIEIAKKLRKLNKQIFLFYKKPTKALEYANSYEIKKVIFIGEQEIKNKKLKVKYMDSGKEFLFTEKELIKGI